MNQSIKNAFLILCVFIAAMLITASANCQRLQLKRYILPAATAFVSGGFEGSMDAMSFHYDAFKRTFNVKNDQFWNPAVSWKNKYVNHDPTMGKTFAGKYMVFTTDGWHMMKFGRNMFIMGAIVTAPGAKRKWWVYIAEGLGMWAINRAGFNIVYNSIK